MSAMPDQLSFLEQPKVIDSLLVMLLPPAREAEQIKTIRSRLVQQHRFKGYLQDRPHVTLHHIGEYDGLPDSVANNAKDALATVKAPPFEIEFDRVMSFGHGRNSPFVMRAGGDISELSALRRQLGEALTKAGLGRHASTSFTPHMTLLYDEKIVPEQAINTVSWTVTEFVLVNSRQGKSEHIHFARFPLRG
jgi:RNA 2',3'-cyclic 3'-phosphodiesterase